MEGRDRTGRDEFIQHDDENMIMINHFNERGKVMAKRILVYNALEDGYDVAYINNNAPTGFETSFMKIKDQGDGTYELTELYKNGEGNDKKYRHNLKKKSDGILDWVIFESDANKEDWKKVYVMEMKKD